MMDHDAWLEAEPFADPCGTCPFCQGKCVIPEVVGEGAQAIVREAECPLCKGVGEIAASEAERWRKAFQAMNEENWQE